MYFDRNRNILDALTTGIVTTNRQIRLRFWQFAQILAVGVAFASPIRGEDKQVFDLSPAAARQALTQVDVQLEVKGNLLLRQQGQEPKRIPLLAKGALAYEELQSAGSRKANSFGLRYYTKAEADIVVAGGGARPLLSSAHRLIAVDLRGPAPTIFSPQGPLSRQELDLIDVQGNSLLLDGLLPGKKVAVGDNWYTPNDALAPLLSLDAIHQSDVTGTLQTIDKEVAIVEIAGKVSGAARGVPSDINLNATYAFDLTRRQITSIAMAIEEQRAIGYTEPGFNVMARLQIVVAPLESSRELHDEKLAEVARQPFAAHKLLSLDSPAGGFRFLHSRDWRLLAERDRLAVLRLVRQGDVIAQCNVHRLEDLADNKQPTIEEFEADVKKSLDSSFGSLVDQSQSTTAAGLRLLKVVAEGAASDVPIRWIYYHLSDKQGRQATVVVTLEQKHHTRLANSDEAIVESLAFKTLATQPQAAAPQAAVDTQAPERTASGRPSPDGPVKLRR